MDCYYDFKCDAKVGDNCPYELISALFENELYRGEEGKEAFKKILEA